MIGAKSLQNQFRDFKIQHVVDYYDRQPKDSDVPRDLNLARRHGRRAPDLLRNEIALHALKMKERMEEAKQTIFDAVWP